ncbi:hypothetical protein ACFQV2_13465 [Actinokineospora soli]|uniref:Uncharacterized protein n=1 Tax=Actinokineospora soli TaxID=1048753 RepID=A0ABW2TKU9_9PSEU
MSANEPLDLTQRYGEAWCVTVTALPVDAALAAMGVHAPTPVADGPLLVDQHEETILLAHQITPAHALVLQLDPTGGWIGTDADVLHALAPHTTACTITYLPNNQEAWFAEPDHALSGIDPVTGRRWGTCGPDLTTSLDHLGYPADADEPSDELAQYTFSQCAALILRAATGLHLVPEHFDNPWIGGARPVDPDQVRDQVAAL